MKSTLDSEYMNYYKLRRSKKHLYNSSEGELLILLGFICIIWFYLNSPQLMFIKPNITAQIYPLGEYLPPNYNSSSFKCQRGNEITQGINITYPKNSTKQFILSFYSSENSPNYHQISHLEKLDFSSHDCHWKIEIENKNPNIWFSKFEIEPGIYRPIFQGN